MELQQSIDPTLKIPQIVPFLANAVRQTNGQQSEGIFRVPGDADAVTDLVIYIHIFSTGQLLNNISNSVFVLKMATTMHQASQIPTYPLHYSNIGCEI